MTYLKNTELAKLYNVSEKTVRNWIQAAMKGDLGLELEGEDNKLHIANTAQNTFLIEQLVTKGAKYKNTRGKKSATPEPEFYKTYSVEEVYDIISNIDIHREIPHKYSYYAEGASAWDEYVRKQASEPFPSALSHTVELLDLSDDYLKGLLKEYTGVNVVDLGVGNVYPVRKFLQRLIDRGQLRRYVALDASKEMLDIAERNVKQWFNGDFLFEKHAIDINYSQFGNLLVADSFTQKNESILNIVLFLGGTIVNLRDPDLALRNIYNSLGKNDIMILSRKLDTPAARRFFDFNVTHEGIKLVSKEKAIVDMLGIDEACYTVEQFFDPEARQRVIQIRLKVDLDITFKLGEKYRVLELKKGETILNWRASHHTLLDVVRQLNRNDFETIQALKSKDEQYAQLMVRLRPMTND